MKLRPPCSPGDIGILLFAYKNPQNEKKKKKKKKHLYNPYEEDLLKNPQKLKHQYLYYPSEEDLFFFGGWRFLSNW